MDLKKSKTSIQKKKSFYELLTNNDNLISVGFLYLLLIVLLIAVSFINYVLYQQIGKEKSYFFVKFPITVLGSLFFFFAIGKIAYDTFEVRENTMSTLNRGLSLYTQDVVVDRWEADAMNYPALNQMYKEIFSKSGGDNSQFLTREEWKNLGLSHVPYIPYDGNEEKWHYAAKFIQELVNIVRMFGLEKKFKVGNQEDLIKSNDGTFAGWNTCFRMYLSHPVVRNVWEQYKYRHVNPKFSAWVQYFVIDVIENDPSYFKNHINMWNTEMNKWLNGN